MTHRLIIPGRLPGLNEYVDAERANRQKGAALKRSCEQQIMLLARSQLRGVRFAEPVFMTYTWVEKDRRRDKDNVSSMGRKLIQDALVKAKILQNDGWNHIAGFEDKFAVDAKCPRIEVAITEVSA